MNSFSIEQYHDLLRQLSEAQGERLNALHELAVFDSEQIRMLPQHLQESLRSVDWDYEQAKGDLDDRHAQQMQAIEEAYRSADAEAKTTYGRRSSEVDLQYEAAVAAAEQHYKESSWVVQSVLDESSESSPKVQHERLKSELQQNKARLSEMNQEMRTLSEDVVKLVESRWQRAGETPKPSPLPRSRVELEQLLASKAEEARQGFTQLRRQIIPGLFGNWLLLIPFVLILGGAVFAPLFGFVRPETLGLGKFAPTEWAAICAGTALVVCIIVLLVLWNVAARKTSVVLEPLLQSAVDALAGYQRWIKVAEEEWKRADHDFKKRYAAMVERRDRSLAEFTAEYESRMKELETQRRQDLAAAAQERDAAIKLASQNYREQKAAEEQGYQTAAQALEADWQAKRRQLTEEHDRQLADRNQQRETVLTRCETRWQEALDHLRSTCSELTIESDRLFPSWDEINGPDWQPAEAIPPGLRIGDYHFHLQSPRRDLTPEQQRWIEIPQFELPAVLPFPDSPSLVLKAAGSGRDEAISILQVGMLRFLAQLPPGDIRLTVIDPVGLGENFASFMHLADYDELLITNRIWTESGQIEEQLAKLTEHMENVFQKYLRNEFESLEEYNTHAGEVAEPYRILIVADFPNGFSERSAQRLISIASSGAKCGVHTMVSVDTQQPMPRDFDLSRLEQVATVMEWKPTADGAGKFVHTRLGPVGPLQPDPAPPTNLMASVIRKIGELSKDARRVEVPFVRIAPREEEYWTGDSRSGIEVPMGRAGATKLQYMRLGQGTSQHVLIAGKTGSGKSTLLHVLITDLALRYSPDEVEFYLIDFKKGVEFKTYAAHALPHARVIAIESDREFGVSVLERLDAVLKERGDLFRKAEAQDVKSFREARPDVKMPRILLMVDEFQEFFIEDDKYSQTASLLIDRLVRQGRAFGMHVLLGSQSLGGAYSLPRTTIGQMAVRIALQCSEADAHMILSENNSAARLLTRPGEAIYNNANGLVEGNNPFQVAWLNDNQRDELLDRIERLSANRSGQWPPAIVFEGNLPANPLINETLCHVIKASEPVPFTERAVRTWLGDSVAMSGPTEARFYYRSGSNLLMVGQDAKSALGILTSCLAALAAQRVGKLTLFAERTGGVHQGGWADFLDIASSRIEVVDANSTEAALSAFAAEVTRRQQNPGDDLPWFLVVDDLSRYRELRRSDDDFGFGFGGDKSKKASPSQMFNSILKEGPAVGLHLIIWCDSYNNVDRWFSRQMLREFEMRAAFQMSAADSSNLIDSPAASRLGNNRAILYSDERGTMEKFRPYGEPGDEWLALLRTELPKRIEELAPVVSPAPAQPDNGDQQPPLPSDMPTPEQMAAMPFGIKKKPPADDGAAKPADNGNSDTDVADDLSTFTVT